MKVLKQYFQTLLIGIFFGIPVSAYAGGMQSPQQNVEEPDAPDDMPDSGVPDEKMVPPPAKNAPAADFKPDVRPSENISPEGDSNYDTVLLQGLNKVTARAQPIEATIGSTMRFGTIEIVAHKCWKSAPDERPENAALLEISEIKQGEAPTQIFLGWMFSSSPGLSALEHPFYDVTVVKCEKTEVMPELTKPAEKPIPKKPGH